MNQYEKLNNELRNCGISDIEFFGEKHGPLTRLVNTNLSAKPYVEILIKYIDKLEGNQLEMLVSALTEKGIKQVVPGLLELFNKERGTYLWAVAYALYVIDDKSSYNEILKICSDKSLGIHRQMLMGTLARMKTKEAYDLLINCLSDPSVKAHAIEGLGRFGNPEAIEILERTEVEKGKYEFKAKRTALRRLERKKDSK